MSEQDKAAQRPRLHYVHGYGFCLTTAEGKKHPLKLDGDGPINDDKRLLRDTFEEMSERIAAISNLATQPTNPKET